MKIKENKKEYIENPLIRKRQNFQLVACVKEKKIKKRKGRNKEKEKVNSKAYFFKYSEFI